MRLTPEVLPMLQLCSCQLTLLTSLAFGAVLAVFSAPLTAQTMQDLPTTIPNLSGYDSETQRTMELACVSEKTRGPVVYGACLNRQIASLQKSPERAVADQRGSLRNSPGIPNSSGYDNETRGMIELACSAQVIRGPAAYRECLNEQVASLRRYESETRRKTSPASKSGGTSRNSATAQ